MMGVSGTRSFVILIKHWTCLNDPPQNYPKCGKPVDGHYCQGCDLLRKELKEVWFTYCIENGIFQGVLDTSESSNDNTNIVNAPQEPFVVKQDPDKNSSQSPPHINHHCCYGCGNSLEDIFCHQCTKFIKSSVEDLVPILNESKGIPDNKCDVPFHDNSPPLDISKYQFEDFSESNDDSTSIDDDSFSNDDIEYVEASPPDSELVSLEVMEIVFSKVRGIDADILSTIKDDILREKFLNVNLLIAKIKALKDNPTPSSDFMTKSSSTSLIFLLEETNTIDNSLPESETLCFDSKENSDRITTTRADICLPDYEAFYDNHVKEISSGSTTTHSDFLFMIRSSLIFRSIHFLLPIGVIFMSSPMSSLTSYLHQSRIVSPLRMNLTRGDFTMDVVKDIFPTREPRVHVHNVLPTIPPFN
nr:hypothetical protein [Tanacetum cinerariifolium]